jgi:hypothetical protein
VNLQFNCSDCACAHSPVRREGRERRRPRTPKAANAEGRERRRPRMPKAANAEGRERLTR